MQSVHRSLFRRPRDLALIVLLCACYLALIGGVIRNCILYTRGALEGGTLSRRMTFSLYCALMMMLVFLVEWLFRIRFPVFLEAFISLFSFCSIGLSTVYGFYELIPAWDTIMHAVSGLLFGSIGLCLAWLVFRDRLQGALRAAVFVGFAFLFALAVGYLWEVYEYACDSLTGSVMQDWNLSLVEDLGNGTYLVNDARGAGLIDTMTDMIVNLAGALVLLVPLLIVFLKKPAAMKLFETTIFPRRKRTHRPDASRGENGGDAPEQ